MMWHIRWFKAVPLSTDFYAVHPCAGGYEVRHNVNSPPIEAKLIGCNYDDSMNPAPVNGFIFVIEGAPAPAGLPPVTLETNRLFTRHGDVTTDVPYFRVTNNYYSALTNRRAVFIALHGVNFTTIDSVPNGVFFRVTYPEPQDVVQAAQQ